MFVSLSDAYMLTFVCSSLRKVLMDYATDNGSTVSRSSLFLIYLRAPTLVQISPNPKGTGEKVTGVQYDNQGFPTRRHN